MCNVDIEQILLEKQKQKMIKMDDFVIPVQIFLNLIPGFAKFSILIEIK